MKTLTFNLRTIFALAFFFFSTIIFSQSVGINEDGTSPHASAILDIKSVNKGLLIPRMTLAERNAIASPATSLMIYQTTDDPGYYFYDGAAWSKLGSGGVGGHWASNGNRIYNTNTGSVGIGTDEPFGNLHVKGDGNTSFILDGATGNNADINFRTRDEGVPGAGSFRLQATEFPGQKKKVTLNYWDRNYDLVTIQELVEFVSDDTVMIAHGKVYSDDEFIGQGAHFNYNKEDFGFEVVGVTTDRLYYGLHADVNSMEGAAVAGHGSNNVTGVEGISTDGVGGYFSSYAGNALITESGNVGLGTTEPQSNVHTLNEERNKLLIEARGENAQTSISMRNASTDGYVYEQIDINALNSGGVTMNRISFAEDPEAGTAISGISPIVEFGTDAAVDAHGDMNFHGELTDQIRTGNANLVPIAYGMIYYNSTPYADTGNFNCTWNSSYSRYEIDIEDEDFIYWKYMVQVTPVGGGMRVATTSSVSGKLLVTIYNSSGNKIQSSFNFVVHKP